MSSSELNAVDHQMIDILSGDGRQTAPQLATGSGIGGAAAYNQLDRLVNGKAITGFAAAVNHGATGQTVAALVLVYVEQGR